MVDRIATLGVAIAENVSKIDRVLDDIRLFLQHIDRRVCNDQRSRMSWGVYDKCMAHPPLRTQSGIFSHDGLQEVIRMKAPMCGAQVFARVVGIVTVTPEDYDV